MWKRDFMVVVFIEMAALTHAGFHNVPVPRSTDCTSYYPMERLSGQYLEAELEVLRSAGWKVNKIEGELAIAKEFTLHSFERASTFMTDVALQAVYACHHPKMTIMMNKVRATLTSTQVKGLTKNDVAMAHFMDNEFQLFE